MAWKTLTLDQRVLYVSKNDPERETNPTKFFLRPLSLRTRGTIRDENMQFEATGRKTARMVGTMRVMRAALATVRYGLAGWENMRDEKDQPVAFETEKQMINGRPVECIDPDLLDLLPASLVEELADEINKMSELRPEERKSDSSGDFGDEATSEV